MTSASDDREYLSSVILIIIGYDLVPDEVSAILRLRPDQTWKRGDMKRSFRFKWGGWKKFPPKSQESRQLPAQLRFWVRLLRERADAISKLRAAGYGCSLDCYISTTNSASITLPTELQTELAALGLQLDLSFFAHETGG